MSTVAVAEGAGLRSEVAGGVLTLTLDRPEKMNALSGALVEALIEQVCAAAGLGVRLLVLRGAGKNFSAGFDMDGFEEQSEGDLVLRFIRIEQVLQAVRHAPFDTLALAHGKNFGAGVDLIAACARRVVAPESTFRMPGLRFGLVLGSRLFATRVGAARAREVLQVSRTFNATEALEWGFATDVASQEHWAPVLEKARIASAALPAGASARLFAVTAADHRDADLAELARSAAEPGLKARIAAYLAE
ncbi:MAG: enoyl-CoA hydratase/isomerase family protein [Usitatibacter sp.]